METASEQTPLLQSASEAEVNQLPDGHHEGTVDAREEPHNLVVDSVLKLKCCLYLLALIAIGFIAALLETETFSRQKQTGKASTAMEESEERSASDWVCWAIKCTYPIGAIAAFIYLRKIVLVPYRIPEAYMYIRDPHSPSSSRRVTFRNVCSSIKIQKSLGHYPSGLFIATYLIFVMPYCLNGSIEIICGVIDAKNLAVDISEIVRRGLLLVFTVMQTQFFLVNYRQCIQWKLAGSWFCVSHIMATNISAWFFNVGLEVREINDTRHEDPNASYCSKKLINDFSRFLYPFAIEYYVMSSLMAYTLAANIGRLAASIRLQYNQQLVPVDLVNSVRALLRGDPNRDGGARSELAIIRRHSCSFSVGLGFVLVSLIVSIFVVFGNQENDEDMQCVFYCANVFLYSCGIVSIIVLMCSLNRDSSRQMSFAHLADRVLLWLGAAAISVNDLYTFWVTWTKIKPGVESIKLANHILLGTSCALNIVQSLMQAYALECALVYKFPRTGGRINGRALLNVLILLNAAEWIVNTFCFNFYFPKDQMDDALVLSLLTMPLQVFYRFHSAACIHEFKKHCEAEAPTDQSEAAAVSEQPDLVADFPSVTSVMDSINCNAGDSRRWH